MGWISLRMQFVSNFVLFNFFYLVFKWIMQYSLGYSSVMDSGMKRCMQHEAHKQVYLVNMIRGLQLPTNKVTEMLLLLMLSFLD